MHSAARCSAAARPPRPPCAAASGTTPQALGGTRFGSGSSSAPVVIGSFGYHHQDFNIHGTVDLPDVAYSMFAPGAGIRFPVTPKLTLAADARLLLPTDTGEIQHQDQYGTSTVVGFDG